MEYQKTINFLGNTQNQSSKFRTKKWIETNDEARGTYNTNSQVKFKYFMLKSSLYDYSDTYILISGTMSIASQVEANPNFNDIEVVFNCAPFTDR